jgi:hypothetical protein
MKVLDGRARHPDVCEQQFCVTVLFHFDTEKLHFQDGSTRQERSDVMIEPSDAKPERLQLGELGFRQR